MSPEERRAAIIAAARPLLETHGMDFTTKQVAEAAGIAEGTIYRAFSSLIELQFALMYELLDPSPAVTRLAAIDKEAPLPGRVEACFRVLQDYAKGTQIIFGSLHRFHTAETVGDTQKQVECAKERMAAAREALSAAVCDLLAPDADSLRIPVNQASAMIRAAASIAEHPLFGTDYPKDPQVLTELMLKGAWKEQA